MIGLSEKKVDKIFENWQNFPNNELFWHLAKIMKFWCGNPAATRAGTRIYDFHSNGLINLDRLSRVFRFISLGSDLFPVTVKHLQTKNLLGRMNTKSALFPSELCILKWPALKSKYVLTGYHVQHYSTLLLGHMRKRRLSQLNKFVTHWFLISSQFLDLYYRI